MAKVKKKKRIGKKKFQRELVLIKDLPQNQVRLKQE